MPAITAGAKGYVGPGATRGYATARRGPGPRLDGRAVRAEGRPRGEGAPHLQHRRAPGELGIQVGAFFGSRAWVNADTCASQVPPRPRRDGLRRALQGVPCEQQRARQGDRVQRDEFFSGWTEPW
jgi:hypothetical protein